MNFTDVFNFAIANGYWIIFLAMCLEGPVVTAAAGFAAALGYFDPIIVLILSVLGDLIPDSAYYWIGYGSKKTFIKRIAERFGLSDARIANMERLMHRHYGKAMIVSKLTPVVSTFGSMLVGYLRLPFRKFIAYCTAITVPKSVLFFVIGYYFGQAYDINDYLHNAALLFPIVGIGGALLYYGYGKLTVSIAKHIDRG